MQTIGKLLESTNCWSEAGRLYARIVEIYPLDEELWRLLINCQIKQGEHAQALHLYNRCREMLSKAMSVMPSAATLALVNTLSDLLPK